MPANYKATSCGTKCEATISYAEWVPSACGLFILSHESRDVAR